jgi:2-hydroxy-6-oxonona-2,4-dienedioate hydrolase
VGEAGAPLIVLTPGGRFSKEIPGLRPLADALVAGGYRVLLWDRPNCGESDVQFYGYTESHMRAETLRGLLTALDAAPCIIAGGSDGARDSMLTVMFYPELAIKLVVWNIVGGIVGTFSLGAYYLLPSIRAVRTPGMPGVADLPEWQALTEANPKNRERILALDAEEFERTMIRWLNAFVSKPGQTIPGVGRRHVPQHQGPGPDHPRRRQGHRPPEAHLPGGQLSHEGVKLIDPPWPEDAWEQAAKDRAAGQAGDSYNMFDTWVQAAPAILDFIGRP